MQDLPPLCTNINPLYAYRVTRGKHHSPLSKKAVADLTGLTIRQIQHYERYGSTQSQNNIDVCRVLSDVLGIKYSLLKNWRVDNHVPVASAYESRISKTGKR